MRRIRSLSPVKVFDGHEDAVKNVEYVRIGGQFGIDEDILILTSGFDGFVRLHSVRDPTKHQSGSPIFRDSGLVRMKLSPDKNAMVVTTRKK